jgi:4'-phosphopantetheinyl transferase
MTLDTTINWQEIHPVWRKFEVTPLSEELHIIRIGISKNIKRILSHSDLLSKEDSKKSERIVREQDKHIFLASTLFKKILCGLYLGCEPQSVELEVNEFHKPKIRNQESIHFNTSHSGDWLVFAFSCNPCGIDVERINHDFDFSSVLDMSFHPDEIGFIQNSSQPPINFFRIWTIKESILKALGTGLTDNLKELNTLKELSKLPNKNDALHIKSFLIENDNWCSVCYSDPYAKIKYFEF